ncbi:hypothetical protein B0T14DRAFT_426326 [Immersiella caudata]|uniref:SH3 domain-containing protein n=1 Tax=Immersiella caudata TaxID=314043 RepID=A0AA39WZB9_9PEZI|nr:hypothetical protein B0T14DRAFT_426326 [Immersiella caudata]
MAVNAEDLLIQPLKDVVALAATAVVNAAASTSGGSEHGVKAEQMLQSAKSLAREGERALRKVQTLWETQATAHGDAFRERILKQGSIENRRLRLEDLLWDFDDATFLDEFSPERYAALQAATKALALDIAETIKRLHLDSPNLKSSAWPLSVFPPLPPLPKPPARRSTGTHSRKASEQTIHQPLTPLAPLNIASLDPAPGCPLSRATTVSLPVSDAHLTQTLTAGETTSTSSPTSGSNRSRLSFWLQSSEETLNSAESPLLNAASSANTTASTTPQQKPLLPPLAAPPTDVTPSQSGEFALPSPQLSVSRTPSILLAGGGIPRLAARPPDCRIAERSTYKRLGGLCPGAIKFRNDENWSSIQEVSEFSSLGAGSGGEMLRASDGIIPLQFEETIKVGRCSECYYSHAMEEVVLDKSLDLRSIRPSPSGANHRLRLLYKSHLRLSSPSLNLTPPRYACLWCISSATTSREGDATVFLSADHLLRHLSTHPQPLPSLSGVSVLHGRGAHRDSATLKPFDLHLPNPATPVVVPDNVAKLPRAIALKDHIPGAQGQLGGSGRKLPAPPGYTGEMLEFLAGAVITGVIFPEKWDGKWCLGRHDGQFGALSVKGVEISGPVEGEVLIPETKRGEIEDGDEGMCVVTRWKWPLSAEKAGGSGEKGTRKDAGWLSFAKGELISDVKCNVDVHADSWCWSGTNSKGKTGRFPKSHVDLRTLVAQKKPSGKEKRKGKGFFGRLAA